MKRIENFTHILIRYIFYSFVLFIVLMWLMKCSSTTPREDTNKYTVDVQTTKNDIDTSIDCTVQLDSDKCKKTIARVKDVLTQGVDLSKEKDAEIESLQNEVKELKLKAQKWDRLIMIIWAGLISVLIAIFGMIIWKYRKLLGIPL
jgi:hypothetical protein